MQLGGGGARGCAKYQSDRAKNSRNFRVGGGLSAPRGRLIRGRRGGRWAEEGSEGTGLIEVGRFRRSLDFWTNWKLGSSCPI